MDGDFLGIHIDLLPDGSRVLTKPHMLQALFDKILPGGPTQTIPNDPMSVQYATDFSLESPPCDQTLFRSTLGLVMQLIDVRPYIAFTVSKIANKTNCGRHIDMAALIYLVHYLYGTPDLGMTLRKGDHASTTAVIQLIAYGDCGFNTHENGKSQYAICFSMINPEDTPGAGSFLERLRVSGMFHFKSWMAPTVDLSSCEGETSTG